MKTDFGDQEEVAGNGKTIDYTLYNYGGSAVLSLTKDKTNALNFNDTQASTIAALGNAALILGGKQTNVILPGLASLYGTHHMCKYKYNPI